MSSLTYFNPPGYGTNLSNDYHYSQAVQLPNNILKLSGQGGWDNITGFIPPPFSVENITSQVDQTFVNIDEILRLAGAKSGWGDVYTATAYIVGLEEYDGAAVTAFFEGLKRWCPEHKPLATAVEVGKLVLEEMRIEIEVEAVGSHGKGEQKDDCEKQSTWKKWFG